MSTKKDYIQYIDETYTVKTKSVESTYIDEVGNVYVVDGINCQFFLIALYLDNKRVEGVELFNLDNIAVASVINDLAMTDLNVIPLNDFFTAFTTVHLKVANQATGIQEVYVNNFPVQTQKFFKVYDSPQYRGNVYNLTSNTNSKPYIVQTVLKISSAANMEVWTANHFDNENGLSTMPTDFAEQRTVLTADTLQVNGMYVKVTSTYSFTGGRYHLLRIYQDVRTNEVYLMANDSIATGTYVPFVFTTLKAVDGGFKIELTSFNLTIEFRNKFF
ncbi:hypothetical protein [Flavobacterium sp. UBA7680]|uniref:hypothetical protein n=1 Tax=Flavobacterium sp. UBA7680 TaxID=1946559 RepID=UPI0025C4B069|nr:hypothetical protein [Flavobacterium sp. UBA7680]